jgi:hypothetical protein
MFKFDDIVTMYNVGLMKATSHTLSVQGAYTLTRLKSEVSRLFKEWQARYTALPGEVGIDDPAAFDARHKVLNEKKRNKDEQKEWEEDNDKLVRLTGLRQALNNDDVEVNCKPMSYEDWYKLKAENKDIKVVITDNNNNEIDSRELFDFVEILGEGILWMAPAE